MFRPWEATSTTEEDRESSGHEKESNEDSDFEKDEEYSDEDEVEKTAGGKTRINLRHAFKFLSGEGYPSYVHSKNQKSNFRKQCKVFKVENGLLYYVGLPPEKDKRVKIGKNSEKGDEIQKERDLPSRRRAIASKKMRRALIVKTHEGAKTSKEAVALSGHRGRDNCFQELSRKYFWANMWDEISDYCTSCVVCQKSNPAVLKVRDMLHPVGIPKRAMAQIGIDLCQLPEAEGFKFMVVAIDYFTKWAEARPLPDKSAASVSRFIYEDIICRHGCMETIISDQGREFNNEVVQELFRLTGTKHRMCRPYHPQANGMVERLNRTLKNAILKTIGEDTKSWPLVVPGVLFAYRVSVQRSTNFSPFYLTYKRHPVRPSDLDMAEDTDDIDEDLHTVDEQPSEFDDFDLDEFQQVLNDTLKMKSIVEDAAMENIKKAQDDQKVQYNKKHMTGNDFYVGQMVLLVDSRRAERKGGKMSNFPRSGPYKIVELNGTKGAVLQNAKGNVLKTVMPIKRLYPFRSAPENGPEKKKNACKICAREEKADGTAVCLICEWKVHADHECSVAVQFSSAVRNGAKLCCECMAHFSNNLEIGSGDITEMKPKRMRLSCMQENYLKDAALCVNCCKQVHALSDCSISLVSISDGSEPRICNKCISRWSANQGKDPEKEINSSENTDAPNKQGEKTKDVSDSATCCLKCGKENNSIQSLGENTNRYLCATCFREHGDVKLECWACALDFKPDSAYRCQKCNKEVHDLPGCSIKATDSPRMCVACAASRNDKKKEEVPLRPEEQYSCLVNGLRSPPCNVAGTLYRLKNTCAFDSLCQILGVAFFESKDYREWVEVHAKEVAEFLRSLTQRSSSDNLNAARCIFLKDLFPQITAKQNNGKSAVEVDCACNVQQIVKTLFPNHPSVTETRECNSPSCPKGRRVDSVHIVYVNLPNGQFSDLQLAVNAYLEAIEGLPSVCNQTKNKKMKDFCDGNVCLTGQVSPGHIFIEIGQANENRLLEFKVAPEEMAQTIKCNNIEYYLRGLVAFQGSLRAQDMGHYLGIAKSSSGTWLSFDDLRTSVAIVNSKNPVRSHLAVYTC